MNLAMGVDLVIKQEALLDFLGMVNSVNLPIASFLFLLHVYWLALVITYLWFIMVCTHIRIHS
jgi:hypothetical protein